MLPANANAPWWHHDFATAVSSDLAKIDLTHAAYLLSAHRSLFVRSASELKSHGERLDEIADGCDHSFEGWQRRLFVEFGFSGNGLDYHDVRNSFLPDVIERRVGIPISLALVGLDLAGKIGLPMWGVSFPGHFLLGTPVVDRPFIDPFNGGTVLQVDDCVALHRGMFGPDRPMDDASIQPVSSELILIRMLMNLKQNYARLRDLDGLTAVLRLRSALPDFGIDEGRELIRLLDATGHWSEAISTLTLLRLHFPMYDEVLDAEDVRLTSRLN